MRLRDIKKLARTTNINEANAYLSTGWILIEIFGSKGTETVFVLGRV